MKRWVLSCLVDKENAMIVRVYYNNKRSSLETLKMQKKIEIKSCDQTLSGIKNYSFKETKKFICKKYADKLSFHSFYANKPIERVEHVMC